MPCLRCAAERLSSGSGHVLPALRQKLPVGKVSPRLRTLVMPAVLIGAVFLVFHDSRLMYVLVPAWVVFAYRLGRTAHDHTKIEETEPAAEDSKGHRLPKQRVEERQDALALFGWGKQEEGETMTPQECPACASDLVREVNGRQIVDRLSVNVPGVYDGALFWRCPFCSYDWHRWSDPSMRRKAEPHMNQPPVST